MGAAARSVGLYGSEVETVGNGAAAEAAHAVLHEGALTLEDYWVRRGARAWFDLDPAFPALDAAAEVMAPLLGWSAAARQNQINHCRALRSDALSNLRAEQPLGAETA